MRFSLLLLPLLATPALAQTSQPAAPPTPVAQPEVILKTLGALDDPSGVPAIVSPDGKRVIYVKRVVVPAKPAPGGGGAMQQPGRNFVFVRCDADGKNPTELLTSGVGWDDMLSNYIHPSLFSADGKLLALPTTPDGKQSRRGPFVPMVLNEAGDQTLIKTTLPTAMGFGYAGQRLIVLEGHGFRGGNTGYRLVAWTGKAEALIEESATAFPFSLRISPDATKVAVYMADLATRSTKIRVIDLKTKAAVESPLFRSDDVTFDGPPLIYWDATSAGVYYHAIPKQGGKSKVVLTRFDVAKKSASPVVPFPGVAVTAVLDADHLAVLSRATRNAGILRLSDQALFPLPGKRAFVMGGRGKRLIVFGRDPQTGKRALSVVTFTLPKANPTKQR